jgi:hypothetical protein
MALGCLRDVVFRFVDADDDAALATWTPAAPPVPRPPAFQPAAAGRGRAMIEVDNAGQALRAGPRAARRAWCRRWRASASARPTAASPACWGPTARARPPRCAWWPALMVPDAGRSRWTASTWPGRRGRAGPLGVLSDARGLYPRLTARENIVYYGRLHGMGAAAADGARRAAGRHAGDAPLLDRRTDGFSQGERMKTALARALVHDPPNIILDEPTNGLDVLATRSAARRAAPPARRDRASASSFPPTSCRRWSGCATRWWWWPMAARWPRAPWPSCGALRHRRLRGGLRALAFDGAAGATMTGAWVVFRKELLDALRDRRTLLMVLLSLGGHGAAGAGGAVDAWWPTWSARRGAHVVVVRAWSTRPRCATTSSARPGPCTPRRPTTSSS